MEGQDDSSIYSRPALLFFSAVNCVPISNLVSVEHTREQNCLNRGGQQCERMKALAS